MWIELSDGRTLGVPLAWFPRLLHGSAKQRSQVDISSRGLHWEDLDEDISIAGLLAGRGDQTRPQTAIMVAATTASTVGSPDTIKVMKEDLVVGKREVEAGGVRVTSHVVETPVQEQVTLHEERVSIERRPVNERATGDAFTNQTIEARATAEEAVVGKDVRVVEEIGLKKQATDRVETVRDSVRETKVDVENVATVRSARTAGTTISGVNAPRK